MLILAGDIYDFRESVDGAHLPPVDVIVCLAGAKGRITFASDLWMRYFELRGETGVVAPGGTPVLYIAGMGQSTPDTRWKVFLMQVRRGVAELLTKEKVILETQSTSTVENAEFFFQMAAEKKWKRILLVTSSYHLKRSELIFRTLNQILNKNQNPITIETLAYSQEPFEPGEWRQHFYGIRVTLLEFIKLSQFRLFGPQR